MIKPRHSFWLSACSSLLVLFLASCTNSPKFEDAYTVVSPATLTKGDPIPPPANEPILTVTGKIGTTNSGDTIQMDLATIEAVGVIAYRVDDLFEEREIDFEGVLMRDLLELWQVADDAETAHFVALNDYVVDIPVVELREYPIMFALKADGEYMQPAYRGPAMIVYPMQYYNFDLAVIRWNWIWQIKSIDFR
jgi:hypothetical protein